MQSSARRRRYRPQLRRSCARQPPHQTPCSLWYALNSFAVDSTFVSCMPSGPMHAFVRTAAGRAGVTAPHVLTIGPFSAPLTAFFKATSRWCRSGASRTRVGAAGALHKYQISCLYLYLYFSSQLSRQLISLKTKQFTHRHARTLFRSGLIRLRFINARRVFACRCWWRAAQLPMRPAAAHSSSVNLHLHAEGSARCRWQ